MGGQRYDDETRQQAVNMRAGGMTLNGIAKDLKINVNTIRKWVSSGTNVGNNPKGNNSRRGNNPRTITTIEDIDLEIALLQMKREELELDAMRRSIMDLVNTSDDRTVLNNALSVLNRTPDNVPTTSDDTCLYIGDEPIGTPDSGTSVLSDYDNYSSTTPIVDPITPPIVSDTPTYTPTPSSIGTSNSTDVQLDSNNDVHTDDDYSNTTSTSSSDTTTPSVDNTNSSSSNEDEDVVHVDSRGRQYRMIDGERVGLAYPQPADEDFFADITAEPSPVDSTADDDFFSIVVDDSTTEEDFLAGL